jgi:hypothetical protein
LSSRGGKDGRDARRQASREQSRDQSRDQSASVFATILGHLVARVPGARGAALVDLEGETVDYSGSMMPFDMRIAAAHWRIVFADLAALPALGSPQWLAVRAASWTYLVYALTDGYALVLVLARRAGLFGWERAVSCSVGALGREAGWDVLPQRTWHDVEVRCDARGRPSAILGEGAARPVEVLGTVVGLRKRERGWRVRLQSGVEATLVREAGSVWYADEPLDRRAGTAGPEESH